MVRAVGLEPTRRETHAPQTCLSAYSSMLAYSIFNARHIIANLSACVKGLFEKILICYIEFNFDTKAL